MAINRGLRNDHVTPLNASGAGTSRLANNNAAALWIIYQISFITSPTSSAICTIKPPTGVIDTGYFAGTGDKAIGAYFLRGGEFIEFVWSGGPASGSGIATYFYDEILE